MQAIRSNKLFKNSVLSFLLNVSTAAISFLAIPMTLKIIGIQEYGNLVFVQAVAMIVFSLVTIQYWQGMLVEFPGKSNFVGVLEQHAFRSMRYEIFGILVAGIVVAAFLLFDIKQVANFSLTGLLLIVVSTVLPSFGSLIAYFRLAEKNHVLLMVGLICNLLRLALLYISLKYSASVFAVLLSYALPEVLRVVYLSVSMHFGKVHIAEETDSGSVDEGRILSTGKWSTFMAIADLPIAHIDKIIVSFSLSSEMLGVYNILKRIYGILGMATSPVYINSIPEFARKINASDLAGAVALWRKTILLLVPISAIIGFACYFSSSLWIPILYRGLDSYKNELILIMVTAVVSGGFITTHALYWSLGKKRQTSVITVISNLCYLILLYVLSAKFGIFGAIGALLLQIIGVVALKIVLLSKVAR